LKTHRSYWPRLAAAAALSCSAFLAFPSPSLCAPEQARSADSFVDSMGVCTHLRYTWSAYNVSGPEVANPYLNSEFWLKSLGIRHIRDGAFEPNVNDEIRHIYDLYGIRDTLVFEPSPVKPGQPRAWDVPMLMDDLKYHATPQAVEAIEGPNESDNDKNFVYPLPPAGGHGFPSGTKEAVASVYQALKSDPATRRIAVVAASTGRPGSQAQEAPFNKFDFEVMHSYNWDRTGPMSARLGLAFWMSDADSLVGPGNPTKPIYATETGYQSVASTVYGVDEQAQSKYLPRIYAEYFRAHVVRTCIYELIDDNGDHYGLIENDGNDGKGTWKLTPKPSYFAVRNLISVLGEAHWNQATHQWNKRPFAPGRLDYTIASPSKNVHHLLLQKSNGDFYLLLWNETDSFDPKTNTDIDNRPAPISLVLKTPVVSSVSWTQTSSGTSVTAPVSVKGAPGNQIISLDVPDSVMIVRLRPRS